jgi:hypothetical protein
MDRHVNATLRADGLQGMAATSVVPCEWLATRPRERAGDGITKRHLALFAGSVEVNHYRCYSLADRVIRESGGCHV